MFIVMVATECAPVAQAGGLGEVIFGLSRELEWRGHRVDIILPKYDCMRYDQIYGLTVDYHDLQVPWYGGIVHCTVWSGYVHGRHCFFIEPHSPDRFFNRGHLYGSPDDLMRFAFFSKAAMEYMLKTDRRPDVIHCHDWQTALVPVLLFEMYGHIGMHDQRVCYTIHNFSHQGVTVTGERILQATGLNRPEYFFDSNRLRDNFNPKALNLMKGGIVYANFVTTVSPQHAWEAMHSDQAVGLQQTLQVHSGKFGGVLNGIDYDVWNPEIDGLIPERYTPQTLDRKYACKEGLRDRFWLRKDFKPIVAYVGRIDRQKGVHLIEHTINYGLTSGAQVVVMGECPDPTVNAHIWQLKRRLNDNPDCHLEIAFNTGLAHLIFAGADMLVMPSMFEPCGLAQMIALKYGTVPIVRAVGGLVDTVFDRDHAPRAFEDRNGFVFHHHDNAALESALNRAIGLWYAYPADFRELVLNGMRQDHSWAGPGHDYLNIYEYIAVHKPPPPVQTIDSSAEISTPTEYVEAPTEHVEAPSERVEAPTERVEVPTERVEVPSERVEVPTEPVEVPTDSIDASPEYVDALLEYVDAAPEPVDASAQHEDALLEYVAALPDYVNALRGKTDQSESLDDPPQYVDASPEYVKVLREEIDMRRAHIEPQPKNADGLPRDIEARSERVDTRPVS
jgi:starch synthase